MTSVDLAAPGVNILSTTINDTYSYFNGTSMATPAVSGVVALVRDLRPEWSYQQVIDHVLNTVDPISAMQGMSTTGGRLNALQAIRFAADPAPEIVVTWDGGYVSDGEGVVDSEARRRDIQLLTTSSSTMSGRFPSRCRNRFRAVRVHVGVGLWANAA